jgi:Na+-transporting methylmalonyl-CoA/oxaloacetate decarboxylase gamma subunit
MFYNGFNLAVDLLLIYVAYKAGKFVQQQFPEEDK